MTAYAEFIADWNGYLNEYDHGLIDKAEWQWLVDHLRSYWIETHGTIPPR
jgi:hypothetical protein